MIGDTVNTAARVEEATRETGDAILVTEATRRLLRRDHGGFVERGDVPLKGKSERVRLYAPRVLADADVDTAAARPTPATARAGAERPGPTSLRRMSTEAGTDQRRRSTAGG